MKNFKRDTSGSITIFLTLILVPCVVFISLFIDLARFEYISYKLQASSDLALNAGLTNYNSTLKEMYGLFGVSEVEETEELISEYFLSNLNVNYGLETSDNFDFYQIKLPEADSQSIASVDYETNLRNTNVLKHQIVEYMKYLGPYEIGTEIFDQIERLSKLANDNKALKVKNDVDQSLEKIDEYYRDLAHLVEKSDSFEGFDYYDELVQYYDLLNESYKEKEKLEEEITNLEIEIKKLKEENPETESSEEQNSEESSEMETNEEQSSILQVKEEDLKKKSEDLETIEKDIKQINQNIKITYRTCIDSFKDQIQNQEDIIEKTEDIEYYLDDARYNKGNLEKSLNETSTGVKNALEEEIKEYNKIIGKDSNTNVTKLRKLAKKNLEFLKKIETAIEVSQKNFVKDIEKLGSFSNEKLEEYIFLNLEQDYTIYAHHKDTKEFIKFLNNYLDNSEQADTKENQIKEEFKKLKDELTEELEIEDIKIPNAIYNNFEGKNTSDELERNEENTFSKAGDDFKAISSWEINLENIRDKLLVIQYATGMFSKYTNNLENNNQTNTYTNIPINKTNNFLYQSELEYILNAKDSSRKNINATATDINLMRFGFNYIYTFTDKTINAHLNALSAPVSGFNPIAGMLFKEFLRLTVAELESILDVKDLQEGKEVPLMKTEGTWKLDINNIVDKFGEKTTNDNTPENLYQDLQDSYSDDGNPFTLNYDDYINLFLLLINEDKLYDRIGDLIELNMTYNENKGVLGESLSYELKNTYTYLQIDSELEADFIFMRLPFVNLFLDEGIRFEKRSMKYKDIKGY